MNSDTSAGLYDFLYREYSTQGRWSQPDPAGLGAADLSNPQSWNRYAYVSNVPTALIDPLGDCQTTKSGMKVGCTGIFKGDAGSGPFGLDLFDLLDVAFAQTPDQYGGYDFPTYGNLGVLALLANSGGTTNGSANGGTDSGFFAKMKDKFVDFLANHADYLPGVCTAGVFGYGTGGLGNNKGGGEAGVLVNKQIGQPTTVEPIGEGSYGPIGLGQTPSETLLFVQPNPGVPAGAVFAANPKNYFMNNSGISIGVFAGPSGHKNLKGVPLAGGFGGGAYLTFSSAANCVKNF